MDAKTRARIRTLGREITPGLVEGSHALFTELHAAHAAPDVEVRRDERYGSDERHRLDVFEPRTRGSGAPVLLFVHGGGFIMGDKTLPGTPFYDNVGRWAAARGIVGATMAYRLAPAHVWPAGAEDVAQALRWLATNVARFGGDRRKIFVMGQSAGAVHAASFVALSRLHGPDTPVAGVLLISGIYDIAKADRNDFQRAYFGADDAKWGQCSTLAALARTDVPLFAAVAELDGDDFQRQAAALVASRTQATNRFPRLIYLSAHNHLSSVLQMGLPSDTLGPAVTEFIDQVCSDSSA
jgi:triacylglycerol lipase